MEQINERKALTMKLYRAIVFLIIGIMFICVSSLVLQPKYQELQTNIAVTASLARNIASVNDQKENYQAIMDESGKEYGNLVTNKDAYISFLGEITMANNLNINKMTVDDVVSTNNMLSMPVKLELQGDLYNVKNMVQQLYDSETVSRINSFSYRLESDDDLLWMWRGIDDETLVPWWDISSVETNTTTNAAEEKASLSADELLKHETALCYLEIEFLGVGG